MDTTVRNPHDHFVKDFWSSYELARDFLTNYLPPSVTSLLDLKKLELSKDSFVDHSLREFFSDLLYQIPLQQGDNAFVYILLEHKSHPEPHIAFHLLRYGVRILEMELFGQGKKQLSPIIPLVLYHGRTGWNISERFIDLVTSSKGLEEYLPSFRYLICDVTRYSDDEIKGQMLTRAGMLMLKYIFSDQLPARYEEILGLFEEVLQQRQGLEYLYALLKYVVSASDQMTEEDVSRALQKAFQDKGGDIMPTIAEKWVEQGFEKGIQQGIQQGVLKKSRQAVIDIVKARWTDAPDSVIETINSIKDETILDKLHIDAATTQSLDEFLASIDSLL